MNESDFFKNTFCLIVFNSESSRDGEHDVVQSSDDKSTDEDNDVTPAIFTYLSGEYQQSSVLTPIPPPPPTQLSELLCYRF